MSEVQISYTFDEYVWMNSIRVLWTHHVSLVTDISKYESIFSEFIFEHFNINVRTERCGNFIEDVTIFFENEEDRTLFQLQV